MKITDLLGIEYPVLLGAMAKIGMGEFAASVSNAGGLGVIASGGMSGDKLREEIRKCKNKTNKPFGVNIMLMAPNKKELAEIIIEEAVPVAVTGAGSPIRFVKKWKDAGLIVISVVPSVKNAIRVAAMGVDALVAEGTEAGGHVGELTTMALVPQVVDAVSIPVIAAGGIADGRGLVAALALGASGVQIGTKFIATAECPTHENFKSALLNAEASDTVVTGRSLGGPVRGLKNNMTVKFLELESRNASRDELEKLVFGSLDKAVVEGDLENGSVMVGQIAGMVNEITTVEEVITSMFEEIEKVFSHIKEML